VTIIDDDTGEEITLPTHKEVCGRCRGTGVHDHSAFANGISQEDFAEDPEFRENYFAGHFDVRCEECHGANVVDVVDEDRLTPEQRRAWDAHCRAESEARAEQRMRSRGIEF
jgi:DnaJ-class molecular chaperone